MRKLVLPILTLILGLGLMLSTLIDRQAKASLMDEVPAIHLHGLGNFRGQSLTVMYVLGSKPILATDSQQVYVSKVKAESTHIIQNDDVELPAQQIEKENFHGSYNMILVLVSAQANP